MDTAALNETIKICFGEMHATLTEAVQVAKAADACAKVCMGGKARPVVAVAINLRAASQRVNRVVWK